MHPVKPVLARARYRQSHAPAPPHTGLIHICTFILLLLSGERNFCVNLNASFTKKLPVDLPPFVGNHADLVYIVIHKLMTDGKSAAPTRFLSRTSHVRSRAHV